MTLRTRGRVQSVQEFNQIVVRQTQGHPITIADVARILSLSQGTVRNHLSSAIGKTGARTRAEAARVAEDRGWL